MLIHGGRLDLTTASSTASGNTKYLRGLCHHVIVQPDTETTTYDIKIVNPNGVCIYERLSEVGTLSDLETIPVLGIYTITISNSTADEAFIIQLVCSE
jgi:hypothetical protein